MILGGRRLTCYEKQSGALTCMNQEGSSWLDGTDIARGSVITHLR